MLFFLTMLYLGHSIYKEFQEAKRIEQLRHKQKEIVENSHLEDIVLNQDEYQEV